MLVGHDWGAMAAYGAASGAPERWRRVVTASVPPMAAMSAAMLNYTQLKRSWYMFLFQSPLADVAVAMDDCAFVGRFWSDWSPGHDHPGAVAAAKDSLRPPGHLGAALGYYRALFDTSAHAPELALMQAACAAVPPQPTLYLHGADDGCVGAEVVDGIGALLAAGSEVGLIEGAGHFLQMDAADEVERRIVEWVTG